MASCPSALRLTEVTESVCPSSVCRQRPLATSHARMIRSLLPEMASCPSALRLTVVTRFVCPSRVRRQRPLTTSHTSKCSPPLKRPSRPSPLNLIGETLSLRYCIGESPSLPYCLLTVYR